MRKNAKSKMITKKTPAKNVPSKQMVPKRTSKRVKKPRKMPSARDILWL
jgi:hypothetical protein